jgi:hypothetical protein
MNTANLISAIKTAKAQWRKRKKVALEGSLVVSELGQHALWDILPKIRIKCAYQ